MKIDVPRMDVPCRVVLSETLRAMPYHRIAPSVGKMERLPGICHARSPECRLGGGISPLASALRQPQGSHTWDLCSGLDSPAATTETPGPTIGPQA